MARKPKPPPRFSATLPAMIKHEKHYKNVSKKVWDTLPEEQRESYRRRVGYGRDERWVTTYQRKTIIAPYINPAVDRLRRKLKRYRLVWHEVEDGDMLHFVMGPKATDSSELF